MCVICVSPKGAKKPDKETLAEMFRNNPHGAGFMYARGRKVYIHKGFMTFDDYYNAICDAKIKKSEAAVYHCRISTQAGVNPEMTHPFPWTDDLEDTKKLDLTCRLGIAHNGVIRMTSSAIETTYSDTALFVADYMSRIIRRGNDLEDPSVLEIIWELAKSKFALLREDGYIATVGDFIEEEDGNLYSNMSYKARKRGKAVFRYCDDDDVFSQL